MGRRRDIQLWRAVPSLSRHDCDFGLFLISSQAASIASPRLESSGVIIWACPNVHVKPEQRRAVSAGGDFGNKAIEKIGSAARKAQSFDYGLRLSIEKLRKGF